MRKLALTDRIDAARLRALLAYDAATGRFRWRVHRGNQIKAGAIAGCRDGRGRLRICVDRGTYYAHRLAWLCADRALANADRSHQPQSGGQPLGQSARRAASVNCRNQKMHSSNTSGSTGVYAKANGTYQAAIRVNYQQFHLGTFKTFAAAVAARRAAHVRYGFTLGHGTPRRRPIDRRPIHAAPRAA